MDRELLVQNIERYCSKKGVKPTNACRDSGVGASFLTDIKRGQTPSVAKVQLLAQYLGCPARRRGRRGAGTECPRPVL